METGPALATAAVILVVILVCAAYAWYNLVGWTAFSFATGSSPAWQATGGADVSRLRFKNCSFVVAPGGGGPPRALDATAVLNGMAVGFAGGTANPPMLSLSRPLNPFSFTITGYNDKASVPDPTAPAWAGAQVVLQGKVRTLPG